MHPTVSLITTFYNSASLGDFVHKAMKSLLSQTYPHLELICVNDGSTDETLAQLKEYAAADSRIVIINKPNEGTAQYAKAAGQDAATGEFAMLFDHDDELSPEAVERAVQSFQYDPELDMVGFIVKTVYEDGQVKNIYALDQQLTSVQEYHSHQLTGFEALKKTIGRYDFHFRGIYRTHLFKKVSFRFTEKLLNADEIVERQLLLHARKIGSCAGVYTHYVFQNSSAKSFSLKQTDIVATDLLMRDFAKKHQIYDERKAIFEKVAYRNFINGLKAFQHFRPQLSRTDKSFYTNRLKKSYAQLDIAEVLAQYSGWAKLYHSVLLKNFKIINTFYRLKR